MRPHPYPTTSPSRSRAQQQRKKKKPVPFPSPPHRSPTPRVAGPSAAAPAWAVWPTLRPLPENGTPPPPPLSTSLRGGPARASKKRDVSSDRIRAASRGAHVSRSNGQRGAGARIASAPRVRYRGCGRTGHTCRLPPAL
ncbi:hypothetical protein DAI22_01g425200 [Oryza sativa Japonica Group]|nr:hypothetical protein DAI22_01g425200 [Oryza sativa Japonica Group]